MNVLNNKITIGLMLTKGLLFLFINLFIGKIFSFSSWGNEELFCHRFKKISQSVQLID